MARARRRIGMKHRARLITSLITEHGWHFGAELGVMKGRTFLELLERNPRLTLVGVDIWQAWADKDNHVGGRSYSDVDFEATYATLKDKVAPYGARAKLLRMKTVYAASLYGDKAFDFVFIDADHTYEGVRADIDAWLPKVRPGGWLMGHDFNAKDFPGVIKAVTETFGRPRTYPDHVWAVTV